MVCKHENGSVVRGIISPPALPGLVEPRSAKRPEHVASQYPRSDIGKTACRVLVVDAGRAAVTSEHPFECLCLESPLVQCHTADSKRVGEVLARACAVAVNGNGEAVHTQLAGFHGMSLRELMCLR